MTLRRFLLACGLAVLPAFSFAQVLPVEQAFDASVSRNGDQVEITWTPQDGYYLYKKSLKVVDHGEALDVALPSGQPKDDPNFGTVEVYHSTVVGQIATKSPTLEVHYQGCAEAGVCYPPQTKIVSLDSQSMAPPPQTRPTTSSSEGVQLWMAIGLALLGGLILNLMPCVLPVLSLKIVGLAHSGESAQRARSHALWYTAGVVTSFAAVGGLVLGLRAAGQAIGWGFQLQHPLFVAGLFYVMLTLGLSMSNVFTLGGGVGKLGLLGQKDGAVGDFFTGVLACVVASPCVAPFMGSALAYALTAQWWIGLSVFVALGVGLAAPFLLIGFVPKLAQWLPKPGAWMNTLKKVLAVPMYLTAAWLAWIVGQQRGVEAVVGLSVGAIVLAMGLYWFERARWGDRTPHKRMATGVMALALVPLVFVAQLHAVPKTISQGNVTVVAFDPEVLEQLRKEHKTVLVNITADWCVTCKTNEKNVFDTQEFSTLMKNKNMVYMVGDWTNPDPQISEFLDQQKAVGVPLYQVYTEKTVEQLPNILSQNIVQKAVRSSL
jgi:thiol:disulfide interchange protein DsbD